MKTCIACFLVLLCGMPAYAHPQAASEKDAAVAKAFAAIEKKLEKVKNYSASFSVYVDSMKGEVTQSGAIVQRPPFSFRRDLHMKAMGGIMNVRELTVCDGTTGWQVESAPDGKVVNVSRWGKASMEELFYAFRERAHLLMLTHDVNNTYEDLGQDVTFTDVSQKDGGYEFTGRMKTTTPQYMVLRKIASAAGPAGISNYMPQRVKLVVDQAGIAVEWVQYNLRDKEIVHVSLSDVRVNERLKEGIFTYKPPKDVMVMDIGRALQSDRVHVPHPLLNKPAPPMALHYLSGKEVAIKPGRQPIVLTFFTSWSVNSRKYLRVVDAMYGKFNIRGVKFITVTDESDARKVKSFVDGARLTLPIYLDPKNKTTKAYGIQVVPKTVLINRKGVVVDVLEGNAHGTGAALKEAIEKL